MENADPVVHLSTSSQRSLLTLCRPPVVETADATSFGSAVPRASGFYAGTLPHPGADPERVVAQARGVAVESGRTHFVWAPESSRLGLACWQHGLTPAYPLAVMATEPPPAPRGLLPADVVEVTDTATAQLFRQVHRDQLAGAPDAAEQVEHFAADDVLLDPSVRAVVVVDDGRPAAAGYLHVMPGASGIYWVATAARFRRRGHGSTVTSALLALAPAGRPVVLQATAMGRPVYLRHGFRDHALVWCWAVNP